MPQVTEYRHGVPSWVDVSAVDVDGVARFYCELFGWTLGTDLGSEAGGYRMFQKAGLDVAGIGPQTMPGAPTSWTTYVKVDDAHVVAAAVTAHGGQVVAGPMDLPNGAGVMAVGVDPTGGFFAFMQPGTHGGARLVNEESTLVWNELAVRDVTTALRFYEAVFGWTHQPMDPSGEGYQLLQVAGRTVAGVMPMDDSYPAGVPTNWLVYFAADDVEASVARCQSLGGAVVVPGTTIDMGRFAVLADPGGAVFAVMGFTVPIDDPNDWPT